MASFVLKTVCLPLSHHLKAFEHVLTKMATGIVRNRKVQSAGSPMIGSALAVLLFPYRELSSAQSLSKFPP